MKAGLYLRVSTSDKLTTIMQESTKQPRGEEGVSCIKGSDCVIYLK